MAKQRKIIARIIPAKQRKKIPTKGDKWYVNWVLDFLNLDIDSLPRPEFFKLLVELGTLTHDPRLSTLGSNKSPWADSEELRKEIKEDQDSLRHLLIWILAQGWMMERLEALEEPPRDESDPPLWLTSGFSQKQIKKKEEFTKGGPMFKGLMDFLMLHDEKWLPHSDEGEIGKPDQFLHLPRTQIIVMRGKVRKLFVERRDVLAYAFVDAFVPFSVSDIRRCEREDCGRYFLKATKKEKRYCSNKCAWVVASRKRRETSAEKERESKRRSYERRRKRELGPKVKVQARKRKEK